MTLTDIPTKALLSELTRRRSEIDAALCGFSHHSERFIAAAEAVAECTGVSSALLLSDDRRQRTADARFMLVSILHRSGLNHTEIAALIRRDRTAIAHCLRRAEHLQSICTTFENNLTRALSRLTDH